MNTAITITLLIILAPIILFVAFLIFAFIFGLVSIFTTVVIVKIIDWLD